MATRPGWRSPCKARQWQHRHLAISIADTARSVGFYERLGLRRVGGSLNSGREQDNLDDIAGALVEVTALAPRVSAPHAELLCYPGGFDQQSEFVGTNDLAATRLVLAVKTDEMGKLCAQNADALLSYQVRFEDGKRRAMLRDPDGHLLCLEAPQ